MPYYRKYHPRQVDPLTRQRLEEEALLNRQERQRPKW